MSAVYLNDINLDMIRFYNQGHNQFIRYGKNSLKIIIDDVCITSLERNKYSVNPKYLPDIVELNQQGQTNAEIAKTLGIAWSTVYNNLNRAGLERNRR